MNISTHWAMEERALKAFTSQQRADYELPDGDDVEAAQIPYAVIDGVAVIGMCGMLVKANSLLSMMFGATAMQDVQDIFQTALDDPAVNAILLYIDSPGGTVAGTSDLAEAIAASPKRTVAYISDLGASAAYWIASQCDEIYANTTADIGSIGTCIELIDDSEAYANAGVKVTLVKSAALKATGWEGVPITDEQIADTQRIVDETNSVFVSAVSAGRNMTAAQMAKVATGQVWIASIAEQLGLIDGVASIEDVLSEMSGGNLRKIINRTSNATTTVAETKVEPVASDKPVETPTIEVIEEKKIETKVEAVAEVKAEATEIDVEAKIASARAEAASGEQNRLKSILAVCKGNPTLAMEQYLAGADAGKAAIAYVAHLEARIAGGIVHESEGRQPLALGVAEQNKTSAVPTSKAELEKEWDASASVQTAWPKKANYVAFRCHELKLKN